MKDQFTDTSSRPLALYESRGGVLPEYATEVVNRNMEKLASTAFADPSRRLFPVVDKRDVILSAIYGIVHSASESTMKRIADAADAMGILEDVEKIVNIMEVPVSAKAASLIPLPEEIYALPEKRAYLINNPTRLGDTARRLEKDQSHIPTSDFVVASRAIVKAATQASCLHAIPECVVRHGTPVIPDYAKAASSLVKRAEAVQSPFSEIYADMAKCASALEEGDADELMRMTCNLDREAGLSRRKLESLGLKSAFEVVFSGTKVSTIEKMASACVMLLPGTVVPLAALQAIPEDVLKRGLRSSVVDTMVKLAGCEIVTPGIREELSTLPEASRRFLLEMALAYGPDSV